MLTVCLITPGPPSSNPRLVKEADALAEAGYDVRVLATAAADWTHEADKALLATRAWSCSYVGGHPDTDRPRYLWTRARHGVSRRSGRIATTLPLTSRWALGRVTPELARAARKMAADMYIAHNLGALPAAVLAGEARGVPGAYDAEDFLPGTLPPHAMSGAEGWLIRQIERRYLPRCAYLTAASPGIAAAYVDEYGIPAPTPILNVFPLSQRPPAFRATRPGGPLTLYWFSQTIGPDRGLEDVVGAMGRATECEIEVHLRGTWHPGYRERLLELATAAGTDPSRLIEHPPAAPDDMVRLAAAFDVGLALERSEPLNRAICLTNKIFTALLAGNAVVATSTEGQRDVVSNLPQAAFSYEPGDIPALARQLCHWYGDREALQRARLAAWDVGTRSYNWDTEKAKFLELVDGVIGGRSRSAHAGRKRAG